MEEEPVEIGYGSIFFFSIFQKTLKILDLNIHPLKIPPTQQLDNFFINVDPYLFPFSEASMSC